MTSRLVGEFSGENCWLLLKSSPDLFPRSEQFKDTSVDYSQLSGFHETKEYKNRGENSYNNVLVEDRNFYQMEVTNIWCSPSYTYLKLDTDTFGRGRGNIRQLLGRHLQGGFWSSHQRNSLFSSADYALPIGGICFSHRRNVLFTSAEYSLHIGGICSSHRRNMLFTSAE